MTAALLLHRADGAALATSFRTAAFGAADPLALTREMAWQGPGGMGAGRVTLNGEIDVPSYPHTEILVVVDRTLNLHSPGAPTRVLGRGEGAVIARGTAVRIQAQGQAVCAFCAFAAQAGTPAGITVLPVEAGLQPSNPPAAHLLLGPTPQCRSDNVFQDEAAGVQAGTWDSTPYHRIVRAHPVNEFMFLLAGRVRLASPDGSVLEAGAGDAVFVPHGTAVGWESREPVAKFYVVQSLPA
jgi:uncharacterized cupin superfamily protein